MPRGISGFLTRCHSLREVLAGAASNFLPSETVPWAGPMLVPGWPEHRVTGTAQHMVVCGSSWGLYVIPHHPGSPHDTGIVLGMDERLFRSTGSSRSQLGETSPPAVLLQLGWDSGSLLVLRPLWMGRDHKPCPVTLQIWALYYLME